MGCIEVGILCVHSTEINVLSVEAKGLLASEVKGKFTRSNQNALVIGKGGGKASRKHRVHK